MTEEVKAENTPEAKIVQEQTAEPVKVNEESPEIKSESNQANWKKFREDRDQDRKARIEAEKFAEQKRNEAEALKAAMEALLNKDQPAGNYPGYTQESDDDIIEKKVLAALQKERIKIEEERKVREVKELPEKLNQTYRDFSQVCTPESLDYLEFHYPEVAVGYKYMPEGFDKWSAMYHSIKRFVPQGHKEDAKRIQENAMKPKSSLPNMTDTKPIGSPWVLSEERKKANWERMQKDQRNIG